MDLRKLKMGAAALVSVMLFSLTPLAQTKPDPAKTPSTKRVSAIDLNGLQGLLKPKGKPLLINFWATWCDPCREEFPDLVKLDALYHGKIDLITVSLDNLEDISGAVPKFLGEMKADMPAFLLHTDDDDAAIKLVSKEWAGNLPLTIFFDAAGTVAYQRNGKFRYDTVKENIDRILGTVPSGSAPPKTGSQPK